MAVHDLVVVGAGPAGIGLAYHLRDSGLDVLVVEANSEVGGRTRGVQLPGRAANTGALFVYRGTPSEELATELGLKAVPFEPRTYGIAMEGRTSIGVDPGTVVDGLPLAREDAAALLQTLDEAVAEYRANTEAGTLAEASKALADVADTVRLSTPVESVIQAPDGTWTVTAEGPDGHEVHSARQVVLAVPAPLVARLAPDLPAAKRAALATAATPGSTTMVVAADVAGVEEHRDWAFVTTVGARFDCIINPAPGPQTFRVQPDGAEIVHFVCYGNSAGYRPDLATDLVPESAEREAWVEDFLSVAPALRGRIRAVHVATWEHCFAVLSPARAAAVEELRRPVDGLHFAGDWSSPTAGTHGALAEARRVADAVSR